MTAVSETNLATKCLDFCQTLSSQGLAFKFSLTVGSNFSFTLDTKVLASDTQAKKKKSSPSTIRRNARRREETPPRSSLSRSKTLRLSDTYPHQLLYRSVAR